MLPIKMDNAFFDEIIYVEYEDSDNESSEELKESVQGKENKKKITFAQSEKLVSKMGGRTDNISKGKIKSDEETKKLLEEWDELTIELNSLGPPCHSSSKWRRVWTKMKCNRKRKSGQSSVLRSRDENKKVEYQHSSTSNQTYPKSSFTDENIINTVEPVGSEHFQQTTNIEQRLSHIIERAFASFGQQQALAHEAMNQKLDLIAKQQADTNVKVNLLAEAIGVDVDGEKNLTLGNS